MEPIKQTDDTVKNLARIEKIKKGLKPINGDCPASLYLAKRGITVLPEKDCYFHPGVEYWKDGIKAIYPAIVSVFRNLEGKGATFHITYLTPDGKKAEVESPKKIIPVVFPLSGCAIQLFKPRSGVLAVAEGIENILAVFQDQGIPGWAAGNSGQLASLVLPNDVVELWIYADPDYAGMEAAFKLAARYSKLKVFVTWPDGLAGMAQWSSHKQDFLDWLIVQNHQKQSET
jgi:putative DNA primase/helicase